MSTIDERRERAATGVALRDEEAWRDGFARPRVFLQPIAAPSALGLAGFSVATFMVAVVQAGWWGNWKAMPVIALFAMFFGGVAQFAAGMWAYKARDIAATVAHGAWGSFWMAFGILNIFIITHRIPAPAPGVSNAALGLWFFGLAYITFIPAVATMFENLGISAVLWTLAAGSALSCVGWFNGGIGSNWLGAGGVLFVISAGLAAYTVMAMCLMAITKRTILPTGELKKKANVPGREPLQAIELPWAEPGVKQGQ